MRPNDANRRIQELESEVVAWKGEANHLQATIDRTATTMISFEHEIRLRKELANAVAESDDGYESERDRPSVECLTSAIRERDELLGQTKVMMSHGANLESKIANRKDVEAGLRQQLDAATRKASLMTCTNIELRNQVTAETAQLEDFQAQDATLRTAEAALRTQLGRQAGKDAVDIYYVDALKSQVKDMTSTQSSLQVQANTWKGRAEKADRRVERMESKLDVKDAAIARLQNRLEKAQSIRSAH